MQLPEPEPQETMVEQLGLREEPHLPVPAVGEVREDERIEVRHVIAREDHRTAHGDQMCTFDRPSQRAVQYGEQRAPRHAVDRLHGR